MIVCYQYAIDVCRSGVVNVDGWMQNNFLMSRYEFIRPDNPYKYNGECKSFGMAIYTPICAWKIKDKK